MEKKISIVSLGCFRNIYDSGVIIERFRKKGYSFVEKADKVDVLIINTCGFIKKAKEESLEWIRKAISFKKRGKAKRIIVIGCLVERYKRELERFFPLVDEWKGVEKFPSSNFPLRILPFHIGFLKISEGCNNNCSYCAIPLIKGKLVSKDIDSIVKEARIMDKEGTKELNIIAQDVTSWGKDMYKNINLSFLLKKILKKTKNIRWFRIIYTHPRHFSDNLIDLIANEERMCKYVDLPIQHINDRILKMMNRHTTKDEIIELIKKIRKRNKNIAIRTSVIVGFPTETEKEFKELLNFIKDIKFERLGAFVYSREEGTIAYNFKPHIHYKIKERRYKEIMSLQREISYDYNKTFLNKKIDVLIDEKENDTFVGRTQFSTYDIDGVVYVKKRNVRLGKFYKLNIIRALEYDLVGQ